MPSAAGGSAAGAHRRGSPRGLSRPRMWLSGPHATGVLPAARMRHPARRSSSSSRGPSCTRRRRLAAPCRRRRGRSRRPRGRRPDVWCAHRSAAAVAARGGAAAGALLYRRRQRSGRRWATCSSHRPKRVWEFSRRWAGGARRSRSPEARSQAAAADSPCREIAGAETPLAGVVVSERDGEQEPTLRAPRSARRAAARRAGAGRVPVLLERRSAPGGGDDCGRKGCAQGGTLHGVQNLAEIRLAGPRPGTVKVQAASRGFQ